MLPLPIKPYIQLLRPANIVTAVADIIAGYAISLYLFHTIEISHITLIFATICLYGGGIVLNDAFDAKLDGVERPERPIPSGKVSVKNAKILGFSLLSMGCISAGYNNWISGLTAISVAILIVLYDVYSKKKYFMGPLNMGMCRGGNLLLGMSANPIILNEWWYLATIPIVYIAAITMVSRGEVTGGNPKTLYAAGVLYFLVIVAQLYISYTIAQEFFMTSILLFFFGLFIFIPLIKAMKNPIGPNIGKAVKAGVISLIVMDATWCFAFGHPILGLITLALMPVSILLSKFFAVT